MSNSNREEEFSFGDKILVAPILKPGVKSKRVYLPKGRWYDYWDHSVFAGGEEYEIATSLETMPIFIKEGAVLPEAPVMQYSNEKVIEILLLKVYHTNKEVNSFLYEDHGDSYAYEQRVYLEKKFTVKGDSTQLTILQETDGLFTESYSEYEMVFYGLPFKAKSVRVDGVLSSLSTYSDGYPKLIVPKGFKKIIVKS
jgi:alpha-glucosidase